MPCKHFSLTLYESGEVGAQASRCRQLHEGRRRQWLSPEWTLCRSRVSIARHLYQRQSSATSPRPKPLLQCSSWFPVAKRLHLNKCLLGACVLASAVWRLDPLPQRNSSKPSEPYAKGESSETFLLLSIGNGLISLLSTFFQICPPFYKNKIDIEIKCRLSQSL